MKRIILSIVVMGLVCGITFFPKMLEAGSLEPTAPPGPTMKTLDEIPPTWSQNLSADDGDPCNSSRFKCVMNNEAVLDKETGLVWERSPNPNGIEGDGPFIMYWGDAYRYCINLEIANRRGWRVPTIDELASIIDDGHSNPVLPSGHPFNLVISCPNTGDPCIWWSISQLYSTDGEIHFGVDFRNGAINDWDPYYISMYNQHVWCVRGGTH